MSHFSWCFSYFGATMGKNVKTFPRYNSFPDMGTTNHKFLTLHFDIVTNLTTFEKAISLEEI